MTDAPDPRRRTFGPVVLLGVVAGVVLAVSGSEPWFVPEGRAGDDSTLVAYAYTSDAGVVTSANALALVGLACWGVLLVTRGRFRRVIAGLGLLTAVGGVVDRGLVRTSRLRTTCERSSRRSPWTRRPWSARAGSGSARSRRWSPSRRGRAAVRYVRHWPEMGTRYDRPAEPSEGDLWKALDQGHDPTS